MSAADTPTGMAMTRQDTLPYGRDGDARYSPHTAVYDYVFALGLY